MTFFPFLPLTPAPGEKSLTAGVGAVGPKLLKLKYFKYKKWEKSEKLKKKIFLALKLDKNITISYGPELPAKNFDPGSPLAIFLVSIKDSKKHKKHPFGSGHSHSGGYELTWLFCLFLYPKQGVTLNKMV